MNPDTMQNTESLENKPVSGELSSPEPAEKKKKNRLPVLIGILLLFCAGAAILVWKTVIPYIRYSSAMSLYVQGHTQEAYQAFNRLKDYRDSSDLAFSCLFRLQEQELSDLSLQKTILFGQYEQDNDPSNGKEPIEWVVLDFDGDRALLISKYILDCQPFNTGEGGHVWENSTLRQWLNGPFCKAAFGKDFRARILPNPATGDAVSLLTDDYMRYPKDRFQNFFTSYEAAKCPATAYAQAGGLFPNEDGFCSWWLRTPEEVEEMDMGCVVWKNGGPWMNSVFSLMDYTHPSVTSSSGVRPVIWLDLDYAPVLTGPKAERPADSRPAFSQIREENAEEYLQAALAGSTLVAEGSVKAHRTRIQGSNSYSPAFLTTYVLDSLTVLAGTYGEAELRIQVPGNASVFEFEEGRRYIVIAGNPQSSPEEGTVYQGFQVRCLLDARNPARIESLILGGYRANFMGTRAEMEQMIQSFAPPRVPDSPPPEPDTVIHAGDPLWNEILAPAPDGAQPFVSITADNAVDYLQAALLDSSFVVEGIINTCQTYAPHTHLDQDNPVQWDIYELKVHHFLAGPSDGTAPTSFALVVPEGDPAGGYEVGGRYIVIINSPDSVFYPRDALVLCQGYQIRCKLAVADSGTITQMRIGEYSADYPRTRKELENLIEVTIGLADHWYNPKDYYVHQDYTIEDVVRRSPVVARVQVQDIQDEPGTGRQICLCTIRVLSDVWKGDPPAAPDQPFRIRVPWGTVWQGQVVIVCIQKHVDRIDRDGNPVCLQPSRTVDVNGKIITVYDAVYEPAAKIYWVTDPYWDKYAAEKIKNALNSMEK